MCIKLPSLLRSCQTVNSQDVNLQIHLASDYDNGYENRMDLRALQLQLKGSKFKLLYVYSLYTEA